MKDVKKFALLKLVTGEVGGNPQYTSLPWPYFPLGIAENNNPITKNINPVKFEFPTSIDTLGGKKFKTNVLFESSERTLLKQVPNYVQLEEIASVDSLGQMEKPSTPKIFCSSSGRKIFFSLCIKNRKTVLSKVSKQQVRKIK